MVPLIPIQLIGVVFVLGMAWSGEITYKKTVNLDPAAKDSI